MMFVLNYKWAQNNPLPTTVMRYPNECILLRKRKTQDKKRQDYPTPMTSEMYVYNRPIRKVTDVTDVKEMIEFQLNRTQ
jgi:hypothetical protein